MIAPEQHEGRKILPVDGYGTHDLIRELLHHEKPDCMWIMTDPRFYQWLWDISDEVRSVCPLVYYHVWDNYPYPTFNKDSYDSNDKIVTISKLTQDIIETVSPDTNPVYLPHAVNQEWFNIKDNSSPLNLKKKFIKLRHKELINSLSFGIAEMLEGNNLVFYFLVQRLFRYCWARKC